MAMVGIKEAAQITGLSVWELRTGAQKGKYPFIRTGMGTTRSKYIFDTYQILEVLEQQSIENKLKIQREVSNFENILQPNCRIKKVKE